MKNLIATIYKRLGYEETNLNDFDYATIGSLVLGLGDVIWLTKDIMVNGFGTVYGSIALAFLVGNIMLGYGMHIHHKRAMYHRLKRRQHKFEQVLKIRKELDAEYSEI